MLGFLIGLAVGGLFGVIVMAMMNIASREDERSSGGKGEAPGKN